MEPFNIEHHDDYKIASIIVYVCVIHASWLRDVFKKKQSYSSNDWHGEHVKQQSDLQTWIV